VFREQPTTRAISEIETPSDFRSRRISAQSSTISTCFLPGSTPARVKAKLVKIQLPHRGQYSVAVDTSHETFRVHEAVDVPSDADPLIDYHQQLATSTPEPWIFDQITSIIGACWVCVFRWSRRSGC
jgi:hypothetical protein